MAEEEAAWIEFFGKIKKRPPDFYARCIEILKAQDIFEPDDLKDVDLAVFDRDEVTAGQRTFLKSAVELAKQAEAPDAVKSASQLKTKKEAKPKADNTSDLQNVTAPDEHVYEKDDRVQFWSQTHKAWTKTIVKDKRADGEVLLACKSTWISKADQAAKMRPILFDPSAAPSVAPKRARAEAHRLKLDDKPTPAASSAPGRSGHEHKKRRQSAPQPLTEENVKKLASQSGFGLPLEIFSASRDTNGLQVQAQEDRRKKKHEEKEERIFQRSVVGFRSSLRDQRLKKQEEERARKQEEIAQKARELEAKRKDDAKRKRLEQTQTPARRTSSKRVAHRESDPVMRSSSNDVAKNSRQDFSTPLGRSHTSAASRSGRSLGRRKSQDSSDGEVPKKEPLLAELEPTPRPKRSRPEETEAKPRGRPKAKTQAQPPSSDVGKQPLDSEAKQKLQEKIDLLEDDYLDKVLRFLEADLSQEVDEAFDLDLDKLATDRQHQLVEVVDEAHRKQKARHDAHARGERTPPDTPPFDPTKESLLTPAVNDTPQFTPQPTPMEPTPFELAATAPASAPAQASVDNTPCPTPSPAAEKTQLNATAQPLRSPHRERSPDMVSAPSRSPASPGKAQLQQLVATAPANASGSPGVQAPPSGTPRTSSQAASRVSSATRSPETREAEDILARAAKKSAKHTPELRESKTPRQQPAPAPSLGSPPPGRLPDSMLDVLDVAEVLAIAEELPASASGRSGEKV
mmetsp:Transcript_113025/g.178533  ORF Transcript_113025/g.178533 Transcript_113025/m.178533 type:complete len:742 (+) Transcript_113025:65-2290(+)